VVAEGGHDGFCGGDGLEEEDWEDLVEWRDVPRLRPAGSGVMVVMVLRFDILCLVVVRWIYTLQWV
jgi:hypothetical protein